MIKPLAVRIEPSTVYRVERALPPESEMLVHIGDLVQPGVPIARALIPAPPANVPVAEALGVRSKDLAAYLVKQVGDQVKTGEVIARKRATLLGGKRECVSPIDGTVDFISYDHGQVTIRRPDRSGMIWAEAVGRVTAVVPRKAVVVEAGAAIVQAALGVGGEVLGVLRVLANRPGDLITADRLDRSCLGCILVGGGIENDGVLTRAAAMGAKGLILGGIKATGHEKWLTPGIAFSPTVVVTDGFGETGIYPPAFEILLSHQGKQTWLRPNSTGRAEVVVLLGDDRIAKVVPPPSLEPGCRVRITRSPFFGVTGQVVDLPRLPRELESGLRAMVAEIETGDRRKITVPLANLELVG